MQKPVGHKRKKEKSVIFSFSLKQGDLIELKHFNFEVEKIRNKMLFFFS